MSKSHCKYITELANTVITMFKDKENLNLDPSAKEIAEAHFLGMALWDEIIEGIRNRLDLIKEVLENDHGYPVYLVNGRYYKEFRHNLPNTFEDGYRCICCGRGNKMEGLRLNRKGDDDFIWQATISQGVRSGARKSKAGIDRTLEAVEDDRLNATYAAEIIDNAQRWAQPANPNLVARIARKLLLEDNENEEVEEESEQDAKKVQVG